MEEDYKAIKRFANKVGLGTFVTYTLIGLYSGLELPQPPDWVSGLPFALLSVPLMFNTVAGVALDNLVDEHNKSLDVSDGRSEPLSRIGYGAPCMVVASAAAGMFVGYNLGHLVKYGHF
jgi:hypothetical protein